MASEVKFEVAFEIGDPNLLCDLSFKLPLLVKIHD